MDDRLVDASSTFHALVPHDRKTLTNATPERTRQADAACGSLGLQKDRAQFAHLVQGFVGHLHEGTSWEVISKAAGSATAEVA